MKITFNVVGYYDRRSAALLGAARALEQDKADQALEDLWRERVRQNEARRLRRKVIQLPSLARRQAS